MNAIATDAPRAAREVQKPSLSQALEHQEKMLSELSVCLDSLSEVLGPVISPATPVQGERSEGKEPKSHSILLEKAGSNNRKIVSLISRISDIRGSVEI